VKILIIEDEKSASEKIVSYLKKYNRGIEILAIIESVGKTVEWFNNSKVLPDVIFMDVQLTDGLCFDIFKHVSIKKPIIFTTAFNQYAIDAFKQSSIDYLLKPITYEHFFQSMEKLHSLKKNLPDINESGQLEQMRNIFSNLNQIYKPRFMVKSGENLRSVPTENVVVFFAEGRDVILITDASKRYTVDYKMEELENMLNPEHFFRIGRSFIVNNNYIVDAQALSNSRLKISLTIPFEEEIIVSREKVKQFRDWFDKEE